MNTPKSSPTFRTDRSPGGRSTRPGHSRRRVALASLAVLALAATACGNSKDGNAEPGDSKPNGSNSALVNASDCPVDALDKADGPVEITVWHAWLGKLADTLEKTADDYNKSQKKVRVNVESQGSYEEMRKKYTDAMATPDALPDLIMSQDIDLQFMIDSGTIIPGAACVEAEPSQREVYEDFVPAVVSAYTVEDVMWPVSFGVSQPALYVNLNHFKAAGLDTEKLPKTLDELEAASRKIMEAKAAGVAELKGVTQPMVLRLDSAWLENWVTGARVPMVNNDNGRSGLATESEMESDAVKQGFDWLKRMSDEKLLNPVPFSNTFGQLFAMALQQSSMLVDTSAAITTVDAAIEGTLTNEDVGAKDLPIDLSTVKVDTLEVGVGANPGFEDSGLGQIGGAAWYIVNRNRPESVAAVWDFAKYSNDTEQQVNWTLEGSYLPIRKSARDDAALKKEFTTTRSGKWLAIVSDGIENLDEKHPGPVVGPYNEFREIYRNAMEKVTTQGAPVAQTMSESNSAFNDALAAYKKDVEG